MPLSFSAFTEIMRRRRVAELIPLLEMTAYKNRFDPSPITTIIRISDRDRLNILGVNWTGLAGTWGGTAAGVARNGSLDLKLNNTKPILGEARFTDLLNIGQNSIGTFDPTMWDAKLFFLPAGGGSGDEFEIIRLILEEPAQITEESVILRFSGAELFLNSFDATANPATIVTVQGVGHSGVVVGTAKDIQCTVTSAGGFRYLIVAALVDNPATVEYTSVEVVGAGVMTLLEDTIDKTATFGMGGVILGGNARLQFYGLRNPPAGTLTIIGHTNDVPPIPPGTGFASKILGAIVFDNVFQGTSDLDGIDSVTPGYSGAINVNPDADSNPRVFVPSSRGQLCVDAAGYFFETAILPNLTIDGGTGQTQRMNRSDAANPGGHADNIRMAMSTRLGDYGSVKMDWNIEGGLTRNWVASGIALRPAR